MTGRKKSDDLDQMLDAALIAESRRVNALIKAADIAGSDAFLKRLNAVPHQLPQHAFEREAYTQPRSKPSFSDFIGMFLKKPAVLGQAAAVLLLSSGYVVGASADQSADGWLDDLEAASYVMEETESLTDPTKDTLLSLEGAS